MRKLIGPTPKYLECFGTVPPDGDVAQHVPRGIQTKRVADASGSEIVHRPRRERLHERLRAAAADNEAAHEAEIEQRRRGPAAARLRASIAVVAPERVKIEA